MVSDVELSTSIMIYGKYLVAGHGDSKMGMV